MTVVENAERGKQGESSCILCCKPAACIGKGREAIYASQQDVPYIARMPMFFIRAFPTELPHALVYLSVHALPLHAE